MNTCVAFAKAVSLRHPQRHTALHTDTMLDAVVPSAKLRTTKNLALRKRACEPSVGMVRERSSRHQSELANVLPTASSLK